MPTYRIIDGQTRQPMGGTYQNRSRATTRADKLDLEYGAVRYRVEPVYTVAEALTALNERIAKGEEYPDAHSATVICYRLTETQAVELGARYGAQ